MKLDLFLAALGNTGVHAAEQARRGAEHMLKSLLEWDDETGEFRFKRIPVRMPGPTLDRDEGRLLQLPAWGLITGGNPDMSRMVCKLSTPIELDSGVPKSDTTPSVGDVNMKVRGGGRKGAQLNVDIEVEFKMGEPPEMLERLRNKLTQALADEFDQPKQPTTPHGGGGDTPEEPPIL